MYASLIYIYATSNYRVGQVYVRSEETAVLASRSGLNIMLLIELSKSGRRERNKPYGRVTMQRSNSSSREEHIVFVRIYL